MSKAFIDDGYTATGVIKGVDGLFENVRFTYRPAGYDEHVTVTHGLDYAGSEEVIKRNVEMLSENLQSWDIRDSKGKLVEINEANLKRIQPVLLDRIYGVVIGTQISDKLDDEKPDPEADQKN